MQVDIMVVAAMAPTIFTGGLFGGFFMLKFITRKEVEFRFEKAQKETEARFAQMSNDMETRFERMLVAQEKRFDSVWDNIDGVKACLTGGPYSFEVRLVPKVKQ